MGRIWKIPQHIFDQCPTYVETRQLVFTSKMFEKHLWKSNILSKDVLNDLLKMSPFDRCFSNILLVKTNYLVYP